MFQVVFVRMQEGGGGGRGGVVVKSSGDTISSPNGCRTSYGYGDDEI
jgi:hypothetical protein